jgi:hypothetical protein
MTKYDQPHEALVACLPEIQLVLLVSDPTEEGRRSHGNYGIQEDDH